MNLIEKANKVFLENFPAETCFERAVFFSWYCKIADCKFCYMSTQPKEVIEKRKFARRSTESILAEFYLCKKLGWNIGFFSGGHKAYSFDEFKEILKLIKKVTGEKIWINIGALEKDELKSFRPYIKGVVGSVETINPALHKKVCPSKPIKPIEKMFKYADELKLMKAITIILGLGETIDDYELLSKFIKKHSIQKIHYYGLNPHPGTIFEKTKPPIAQYQAKWIAKTRIEFPKMDIQCGIWADRANRVPLLLKAGSNSISKFPALRYFGRKEAKLVEEGAKKVGRKFRGTLTKLPKIKYNDLNLHSKLKERVIEKSNLYLKRIK